MRNFLIIFFVILLSACSIYPGSYYYPESSLGNVVSSGSCGDNTPSKWTLKENDVELSAQAASVLINYDQTWIWFQANSKVPFTISALPENISFYFNDQEIEPHEISYFYTNLDTGWVSFDHKNITDLQSESGLTTNFRIVFKFKKVEGIHFKIDSLKISEQPVNNIDVHFKNIKAMRMSALNC